MKIFVFICLQLLLAFNLLRAQQIVQFPINQTDSLIADAGNDIYVPLGSFYQIGSMNVASGGQAPYSYHWFPDTYLDDATLANPTVSPLNSITYTLTVFDADNCSAIDSVFISIDSLNTINYLQGSSLKPMVNYIPKNTSLQIQFNEKVYNNEKLIISLSHINGTVFFFKQFELSDFKILNTPVTDGYNLIIATIIIGNKQWSYKIITY